MYISTALLTLTGLLVSTASAFPAAVAPRAAAVTFCTKDMTANFTAEEMQLRFDAFATAFLVDKDMDEAFSYIAPEYVNHNPLASDGAQVAYDILSPIWPGLSISVLGTMYKHEESMGWLNYNTGSFGTVVDRYRYEGGCIVEHWDQGEQYPTDG